MEIQFGSYKNLNDPREAKTWPFIFYTSNIETNNKFKSSIFEEVSNYIIQKTLVLCCTQDDPSVTYEDEDRDIRSGYGDEFWITGDNFYVITRYNHSPKYAMVVYQLAKEIKRRKDAQR
ncbi:MAG: hypothetical protein DSZ12_06240 [Sulfurovum sp.]|nr:MAG: hypothetical protein DSZ12_06240 [Sulfurovum sp.]